MGLEGIIPISEIVKFDGLNKERFNSMLSGYFIADNLNPKHLETIHSEINFKGIVSIDGKTTIKNVGGAISLGVIGDEQSLNSAVSRNNKITALTKELEDLNYSVEKLTASNNELLESIEKESEEIENKRSQYLEVKESFISKKSSLESKIAGFESSNSRLEILKNRKSEISKSRLTLLEAEDQLQRKVDSLNETMLEKNEALENENHERQDFLNNYEDKRDEFLKAKAKADSFKGRVSNLTSQIEDIEKQLERSKGKISNSLLQVEGYESDVAQIEKELKDLEESNLNLAEDLKSREDDLSLSKDKLSSLLLNMKEREDEVKELTRQTSKLEKEMVEYEMKLGQYLVEEEQVVRDSFEKYQVDLRDCLGTFLEYEEKEYEELNDLSGMYTIETEEGSKEVQKEDYQFNRRYGQDLKDCSYKFKQYKSEYNRLGEINWKAIEDADDARLVASLAMICPFQASEKQALLEAPDLTERARVVMALLEMALVAPGDGSATSKQ